jgi:carboxylesterase type B
LTKNDLSDFLGDFFNFHLVNLIAEAGHTEKMPVMVWIHGGPEYFMDYDVIVVSVNYRVGPLGFFTLENEQVNPD